MKKLSLPALILISFAITGCVISKVTNYTTYQKYNAPILVDTLMASEDGVSIIISNLDLNEYLKPEYAIKYNVLLGKNNRSSRHSIINLFKGLTAYNVEIVNNTADRLDLSNVTLVMPDVPKTAEALSDKEMEKFADILPYISHELLQLNKTYSSIDKRTVRNIRDEVLKILNRKRIISRSTYVKLRSKVNGHIVFLYDSEKITRGKIVITYKRVQFLDIRRGSDIPTTEFTYKIKQEQVFTKREHSKEQKRYLPFFLHVEEVEKHFPYVRISEEEYTAAQNGIKSEE
jgi:hypothetical protein